MSENLSMSKAKNYSELVFFTGFALLICHELDAVAQSEWRLLPFLNQLADDLAYVVFVALHIPLFAILIWLVGHQSIHIRLRSQIGVDIFLIVHACLHWILSNHELYTFHSLLSEFLIFGGGAVGLFHMVILKRTRQNF
ncbi:MAG: hypothetical protein OQJ97_14535 [Rhodospirillales bacterium]|nr:hypothetical protein [Rhodospirillales bacterium]